MKKRPKKTVRPKKKRQTAAIMSRRKRARRRTVPIGIEIIRSLKQRKT